MLWQVFIILHSWIFCWLLPIGCSVVCFHLRVKQRQSFSQDQTLHSVPSAPSCCLHITDTSLSKAFQIRDCSHDWILQGAQGGSASFPELDVSQLQGTEGCGCVSVLFWDCAWMWWNRAWSVVFSGHERERGCNWDSWVNGSLLWQWRCWQGEVILVLWQVRCWKCQCAAKACHPFIVSGWQMQSLGSTKSNVLLPDRIS